MLTRGNSLKGSYHNYLLRHSLKQLIAQVPPERRPFLAEEIQAKAAILGCKDKAILQSVLEQLKGDNNEC